MSESDNQPAGGTLSDGYTETGNPAFTSEFGCSNGIFCDIYGDNRTGNWAVDIDNVSSAAEAAGVPEPGTVGLTGAALAGMAWLRRRKRRPVI